MVVEPAELEGRIEAALTRACALRAMVQGGGQPFQGRSCVEVRARVSEESMGRSFEKLSAIACFCNHPTSQGGNRKQTDAGNDGLLSKLQHENADLKRENEGLRKQLKARVLHMERAEFVRRESLFGLALLLKEVILHKRWNYHAAAYFPSAPGRVGQRKGEQISCILAF